MIDREHNHFCAFFFVISISEMSGIIRSIWRNLKPFCELTETEMTEISQKSVVTMFFLYFVERTNERKKCGFV